MRKCKERADQIKRVERHRVDKKLGERKQMEESLRASEERYRLLTETAMDFIYIVNPDLTLKYLNSAAARPTHRLPKDLIEKPVGTLFPPGTFEIGLSKIKQVLETGDEVHFDEQLCFPGKVLWANTYLIPIKDLAGKINAIMGITRDISEHKRAEESLRACEEKLKTLLKILPVGVGVLDADQNLLYDNSTFEAMFGLPANDLRAGEFNKLSFLRSDGIPMPREEIASVRAFLEKRAITNIETWIVKKDGQTCWAIVNAVPVEFADWRVVIVCSDITKLKQAEQALRENEEKYRNMVENAVEAIIIAQDGMLKVVNQAASKISGYSRQELCFLPFIEFIHPDDRQMVSEHYAKTIEGTESLFRYEFRLINKTGQTKWMDIYGIKVAWEGKPATMGFLNDISESKQAEEALRTSEAQLSNALKIAHAGHWEYDVARDMFTFNDNFYRIFRTTAAEAGGYQMSSADYARRFCLPEDSAMVAEEIRAAIESSDPNFSRHLEHRILYADGEVGTISVRFFIVKDAQGRTVKTYGVNQDITDRKQTEEALRQAEENFRRSMDESPLGIRIISAEGETLYANRAILDIYGYDDIEELRSTPVNERYTPASYAEFQLRKKMRMNGEDYPSEYEISIIGKTGEVRHLLVFRKEILWDGKKQFQAIYQDITERKKAEKELEKTLGGLRNAISGIIHVLSATTEKRDPYTAGHQKRVADLALAIGQELGFTKDRLEGLYMAGVLHDIGKVSIPAEILAKPTRLTEAEFLLIQAHPQVGYDILRGIDFARPIAKMILQHHERMNGSGYPNRLKGEEILLESRILAVSDVVEAVASHRPYRPALGIEAALKEIEADKGALYDPAVVTACLKLFREKGYALAETLVQSP